VRFDARSRRAITRKTLSAKCGVWLMRNRNCFSATRDKRHVADRHGRCAARSGVDQRHLAKNGVIGQRFEHAIAEKDLDPAVLNDEQLLGIVALMEDDITGLEFAHRHACASQYSKIDRRVVTAKPFVGSVTPLNLTARNKLGRQFAKSHAHRARTSESGRSCIAVI
jgi:hypothetical protein